MMLLDHTDACTDGGIERSQRPSTAGEPSLGWESRRSAGKRMSGAALAERSDGGWPQEGLTLHGADGSNGYLHHPRGTTGRREGSQGRSVLSTPGPGRRPGQASGTGRGVHRGGPEAGRGEVRSTSLPPKDVGTLVGSIDGKPIPDIRPLIKLSI